MANLVFLPWLRRGLATAIARLDQPLASGATAVAHTTFATKVAVKSGTDNLEANVNLPLIGPGDIAGLDPRVVVRTTPLRDESDAEFKHFVAIEFDQADLPWRYTPAATPADQHLHPWISLVVLKDTEWSAVPPAPGQKLPVADITVGAALPDLNKSWAWAHVQLHGAAASGTQADIEAALKGAPGQFVARILSPRLLRPQTRYTAMLVPTYQRGALAGLGQPVGDDVDALTFAFTQGTPVKLPIYYQWQFQTGVVGSFKDLVALLKPQKAPTSLGRRDIDVSQPGFQLRSAAAQGQTAMPIEGALQSIENAAKTQPDADGNFVSDISTFANKSTAKVNGVDEIIVTPPLYGRWHATEAQLTPTSRLWFRQLNSNPLNRAGGGLGTQVVEESQQELMASAWAQFESLQVANTERRYMQLGNAVLTRLFNRHLKTGSQDTLLQSLGTLARWVLRSAGDVTVHAELAASAVGSDVFEPQWRRLTASRGLIGRRQLRHLSTSPRLTPVTKLAGGTFKIAPAPPTPPGMVTPAVVGRDLVPGNLSPPRITTLSAQGNDPLLFWGLLLFCVARKFLAGGTEGRASWWIMRVLRLGLGLIRMAAGTNATALRVALRDSTLTGATLRGGPKIPTFTPAVTTVPNPIPPPPATGASDSATVAEIRAAWADGLDAVFNRLVQPTVRPALNMTTTINTLTSKLAPGVTLVARAKARLLLDSTLGWNPVDQLEPVQAAPEFPQPMWVPLRDVSLDWILPGVDQVGTNTVGAVVTNQRFIEAYMVGLNHEMARTLLWNEYPTDQRGSYFRQFWDSRGVAGAGDLHDIRNIHEWTTTDLGTHTARQFPISLVLLVRADLIRRYPNVVVYALPAQPDGTFPPTTSGTETLPLFSGRLGGDIAFYGFPASVTASSLFVLQEQPAEPRFGLQTDPPATPEPAFVDPGSLPALNAGEFARETFQFPTRVAIPGALFLTT